MLDTIYIYIYIHVILSDLKDCIRQGYWQGGAGGAICLRASLFEYLSPGLTASRQPCWLKMLICVMCAYRCIYTYLWIIKRFFFEYVSIISQDHWQLYHSATVLMGLCTLLMLLVVKGSRNLTTLTTISLICLAIANTGDFQWKGSMNKFQTIFLFDISLTFYHICFIFLEIFFFFPFLDTNEIFLITCLLLYFTILLFIMKTLAYSFTLGEAMVVTQTIVILLVDYMFSIYNRVKKRIS